MCAVAEKLRKMAIHLHAEQALLRMSNDMCIVTSRGCRRHLWLMFGSFSDDTSNLVVAAASRLLHKLSSQ